MTDNQELTSKKTSTDWLLRGVLTKIGDTFDKLTGRRWIPSSSLAASELVDRMKKLLDAEAQEVPGKGLVIPHNIKLKIQWDKFSTDSETSLKALEIELLTASVDHINDRLYYTYAPLTLEVKPDYFTSGVKLLVSFDKFTDEEREVEMNVTEPSVQISAPVPDAYNDFASETFIAKFEINGISKEKRLSAKVNERISVGRTSENTFVIDDASVSKIHASLVVGTGCGLAVADTGSTNGTFVNGERIAYGKAVPISDRDKIKFGTVEVEFEHVPRPDVIVDDGSEETPLAETVEIHGFEFTSRISAELETDAEVAPQPADIHEDTMRIEPQVGDAESEI